MVNSVDTNGFAEVTSVMFELVSPFIRAEKPMSNKLVPQAELPGFRESVGQHRRWKNPLSYVRGSDSWPGFLVEVAVI